MSAIMPTASVNLICRNILILRKHCSLDQGFPMILRSPALCVVYAARYHPRAMNITLDQWIEAAQSTGMDAAIAQLESAAPPGEVANAYDAWMREVYWKRKR